MLCYVSRSREFLRQPGSIDTFSELVSRKYEGHRSPTLMKVKVCFAIPSNHADECLCQQTFYDAEAIVTGYIDGKGKNQGVTGALQCRMESGKVMFTSLPPSPEPNTLLIFCLIDI